MRKPPFPPPPFPNRTSTFPPPGFPSRFHFRKACGVCNPLALGNRTAPYKQFYDSLYFLRPLRFRFQLPMFAKDPTPHAFPEVLVQVVAEVFRSALAEVIPESSR